MNRGLAHWTQHDVRLANEDFTQVIKLNPRDAQAYLDRGLVRILQMQDVEAQQDFDACLRLQPGLKKALDKRIADAHAAVAKQIAAERAKQPGENPKTAAP
jgi:regulator of sirC expression with transglutaminase-like and TPR domain